MIQRTAHLSNGGIAKWACPNKCNCNKVKFPNGHTVQLMSQCERNPTIKCEEEEI